MTKYQKYLLMCLQEECNELAQRISKALRFGINEKQSDGPSKSINKDSNKTNAERINDEWMDLECVRHLCSANKILPGSSFNKRMNHLKYKEKKIKKYFKYSKKVKAI